MKMNTMHIPPAQIWIGKHHALVQEVHTFAETLWCPNGACGNCATCTQIKNHQHHNLIWLWPENAYTLEDIALIHATQSFALEDGEHIFFIIQKADHLTPACANNLLKSVEEPTPGYHFIFLTERPEKILATVRSRCTMRAFQSLSVVQETSSLANFFTHALTVPPLTFTKELDLNTPTERESMDILDEILQFWLTEYKNACLANNTQRCLYIQNIIHFITYSAENPPMPGGSKIFWKNFALHMHILKQTQKQ